MAANRVSTPEEKLKILLEGLSGTISVSDLCRKYDLKSARFYYWKDQLLESAPEIFENRGRKIDEDRIRDKVMGLGYDFRNMFVDASNMYTFMEENDMTKRGHNKKHRYDLNQISYYIAANYD